MRSHCQRFCLLIFFTAFCSCAAADGDKKILNQANIEPRIGEQLPFDAIFFDQAGREIELGDIFDTGRPTIICLVYFDCPMLCKLSADGLVRAAASIEANVGDTYNIAFISFDPRDTVKRAAAAHSMTLRKYGRADEEGWYFLTGEESSIRNLTEAIGFHYAWDAKTEQYAHSAGLVIISPEGKITHYLDGVHFAPTDLISALNRAKEGTVTQSTPPSFIRCYLYDPTTGQFGSLVQWSVRALGILTVAALGLAILKLKH